MSYCLAADVQSLVSPNQEFLDGPTPTTPTLTQVNTFIGWVAAELDTIMTAQGYTTPVTAPADAVTVLEMINAAGAAAYTEEAVYTQSAPNESSRGGLWRKKYEDFKTQLRQHPGELINELLGTIQYDFTDPDETVDMIDENVEF